MPFKLNVKFGNTCTSHSEPQLMNNMGDQARSWCFPSKMFSGKAHCKPEPHIRFTVLYGAHFQTFQMVSD